jgi:PmbA protein
MKDKAILDYCINKFRASRVDKFKCCLVQREQRELYFNNGEITMFRTVFDTELQLTVIIDHKEGVLVLNKTDKIALDKAIDSVITLAQSSAPDTAKEIGEQQPKKSFSKGPLKADNNKMHLRLNEFLAAVSERYPITHLEEGGLAFCKERKLYINSNETQYLSEFGCYKFSAMFTSKLDKQISSFNHTSHIMADLDEKLLNVGNIKDLLTQSEDEINAQSFDKKIVGDIIITPNGMSMLLSFFTHLQDYALISNSSKMQDKLEQKIASDKLTIIANPVSDKFAVKYFFSNDGYENRNRAIVENGILKSFLLSLYGANKTGKSRADTVLANLSIDAGNTPLKIMIESIKQGIIITRFSGASPNDNGDFAGVAKNSYYIEDGEIKYPVKELMITGNVFEMLENISTISAETISSGYTEFPWIKVNSLTIAGK